MLRVKKAAGKAGIPVPHLLSLCEDERYLIYAQDQLTFKLFSFTRAVLIYSIIGTPFYLMRYVSGRVIKDPALPGVEPSERREIYNAMCRVLATIHSIDVEQAQLENFGKHGV